MADNLNTMINDAPIMRIENLKTYFDAGKKNGEQLYVKAVDNVSLDIRRGEVIGLVGESGSGKSTIAYTIMGMYKPTAGKIYYKGEELPLSSSKRDMSLRRNIQIVFQDPGTSLNPFQTVQKILEMPLKVHKLCKSREERQERVKELLRMVELPENYMYKTPGQMGGGERQMISIARALACEPEMIILDEPTSALDVSIQAKIINMLLNLQREKNLTYLFITHDLSLMRNISTRVAILYLGRIAELAPTTDFFQKPQHPYTKMLLSSIPVVSEEEDNLKPEKVESVGEIPSPVNIPPGCSFHQRCYAAADKCCIDDPEMRSFTEEHFVRCHMCKSFNEVQ